MHARTDLPVQRAVMGGNLDRLMGISVPA